MALEAGVDREEAVHKPSLDPLSRLIGNDLEQVNRLIVDRMQSPVALIPQLAGHIVASGGKRLRPMLTLGCALLCGYRGTRHVALAAAVEFIHTATLLHDDVVDASDLRRGRETANAVWGNEPAILVGDFLFSRSFELMVADGSLRILEILSRASSVIAEGEVLQLMTQNNLQTTEASYLEVIRAKTAELFAAASRLHRARLTKTRRVAWRLIPFSSGSAIADRSPGLGQVREFREKFLIVLERIRWGLGFDLGAVPE